MNGTAPGRIRLGALLFFLVVVAGVFLASKFIPPYWTYLSMVDPVKEAAMAAVMPGGEGRAREELIRRAKEQGLKLTEDNVAFIQEGPMLVIRVTWVARLDLPRYRYDIPFLIEQRVPRR